MRAVIGPIARGGGDASGGFCEDRLGLFFFSRASGKDDSSNQLIRSSVAAFSGG